MLATGETHTVREFATRAFARAGIDLEFVGEGIDEKALDAATGNVVLAVDHRYFRPAEVDLLIGDAAKAKERLGWEPSVRFAELVDLMVDADRAALQTGEPFAADRSFATLVAALG